MSLCHSKTSFCYSGPNPTDHGQLCDQLDCIGLHACLGLGFPRCHRTTRRYCVDAAAALTAGQTKTTCDRQTDRHVSWWCVAVELCPYYRSAVGSRSATFATKPTSSTTAVIHCVHSLDAFDAMLARILTMTRVYIYLSQVGVLSKGVNGVICFFGIDADASFDTGDAQSMINWNVVGQLSSINQSIH